MLRAPSFRNLPASLLFVLAGLALTKPCSAQAESKSRAERCTDGERHILVIFEGDWDASFRQIVLVDLAAGLTSQEMTACSQNENEAPPIAVLRLSQLESANLRIDVQDTLTNKRVTRDISLSDPEDSSSALMIAVAADELLRATWAELSLRPRHRKEPGPAQEVSAAPPPVRTRRPLPLHRLKASVALDTYSKGSLFWGLDLGYGSHIADRIEWDLSLGPRFHRDAKASPLGGTQAEALVLGFDISKPVYRSPTLLISPVIGAQAGLVRFAGTEADESSLSTLKAPSLSLRAGLLLRISQRHSFFQVKTQLGAPLVGIEVTDGDSTVGGVSGLEWTSQVSVGWLVSP